MAVNKVVINDEVVLDLTADTITPDKLAKGITAHDKSGAPITGTSTKDADTSDATAAVAEVLKGKTFYARGTKMTGTMAAIAEAKLAAWPIGSIYMTVSNTSPESLFGGTWERISERFLLGASGSFLAGSTGGEYAHTLTQSELPNYSLSVTNGSNVIRSKTGSSADAYVQTQSGGWGIPNWESKTVTVASGGSGKAHNNMPPYLAVYMWKRTK